MAEEVYHQSLDIELQMRSISFLSKAESDVGGIDPLEH